MSRDVCEFTARLQFHISQAEAPKIFRHCARCKTGRKFVCSRKFRVNAQGKSLDAWLIYRCDRCDYTWNYAIYERTPVRAIDAAELNAMMQNDAALANRYAFDVDRLAAFKVEVELAPRTLLRRVVLQDAGDQTREITIAIIAAAPCRIRLDRALSLGLSLQRSEVNALGETPGLVIRPKTMKSLRRAASDGQEIVIDLSRCPSPITTKCLLSIANGQNEIAILGAGS